MTGVGAGALVNFIALLGLIGTLFLPRDFCQRIELRRVIAWLRLRYHLDAGQSWLDADDRQVAWDMHVLIPLLLVLLAIFLRVL